MLFLCPHAAAKSVIATAMLRDLADRNGLAITVANAGTDPDDQLNQIALEALRARSLDHDEPPRCVTAADIDEADIVVTFGCTRDELPAELARWVDWSDAPDASVDIDGLIRFIGERLTTLTG